jgi:protein gp37
MKNKIGWCSMTWNPAIGCKRNCDYCYGREMNRRFGFIKDWTSPEWKESNFNKKFPNKSQKIFIASMSEIRFWKKDWISRVFKKIKGYPQHTFQFLTKYPYIYHRLEFPAKAWLGFTVKYLYFTSIEPILEKINPLDLIFLDWVILGAETGKRKGKVIPKREWIGSIVKFCRDNNIPIYLKDSLRNIYPEEIKEFPETELKLF